VSGQWITRDRFVGDARVFSVSPQCGAIAYQVESGIDANGSLVLSVPAPTDVNPWTCQPSGFVWNHNKRAQVRHAAAGSGDGSRSMRSTLMRKESCAICACRLHRSGEYATPTKQGRSHATWHHFVAVRFFGRSANRKGTLTERVFAKCPWGKEKHLEVFCYECHELLLHNPVLLPEDVARSSPTVASGRL
jgi:hypothetical protein